VLLWLTYKSQTYGMGKLLGEILARIRLGHGLYVKHRETFDAFDEVTRAYWAEHKRGFWVATGVFGVGWLLDVAEVAIFAVWLDLPLSPAAIFAIASLGTAVKAAAFFVPGSLGVQEGGWVLLFAVFGESQVVGMSYAVARRVRELFWIAFGLAVLGVLGLRGDLRPLEEPSLVPSGEGGAP
jgi:uncharacterized membrane protein YbhN (UPF0104 family)